MNKDTSAIIGEIHEKIAVSLNLLKKLSTINKLKNNKAVNRKRYSQLVCLMFGFLMKHLETLKDHEVSEAMQFSVHVLNGSLSKYHSDLFEHIDLKPNKQGGFSKLNGEICNWYSENFKNKTVRAISATGSHLFLLTIKKNSINFKIHVVICQIYLHLIIDNINYFLYLSKYKIFLKKDKIKLLNILPFNNFNFPQIFKNMIDLQIKISLESNKLGIICNKKNIVNYKFNYKVDQINKATIFSLANENIFLDLNL
jgi:hypothetical protein